MLECMLACKVRNGVIQFVDRKEFFYVLRTTIQQVFKSKTTNPLQIKQHVIVKLEIQEDFLPQIIIDHAC